MILSLFLTLISNLNFNHVSENEMCESKNLLCKPQQGNRCIFYSLFLYLS